MADDNGVEHVWKVLVVDDEPGVRSMLRHTLESRGIGVCVAESAESAVHEMKICSVGMILMDVLMPGMGGLSLAQDLRLADPYLPILFIAGNPDTVAHLNEDERAIKGDADFTNRVVRKVREEMSRYVARYEARSTARIVRAILPRVIKLEESRVIDGEVLKAHTDQLRGYASISSKAMLVKQILAALLSVVAPILGGLWYLTKDIAKDQLHEITEIKPMRLEQRRISAAVDVLVEDGKTNRVERQAISAKQEVMSADLRRILERIPPSAAPPRRIDP